METKAKIPVLTVVIAILVVVLYCAPLSVERFAFIPSLAAEGQWWRTVTGHFVHLSFEHFLWDSLTFVGLAVVLELRWPGRFRWCLGLSSILIPWVVHAFDPGLYLYAGLSGLDCALFALLATSLLKTGWAVFSGARNGVFVLLLLSLLAKVAFETMTHTTLLVSSDANFEVVPIAHMTGGLLGFVCAWTSDLGVCTRVRKLNSAFGLES